MATAAGKNNGDLWLLKIQEASGSFVELGYATATSISLDQNLIDVSNKNSSRWAENIRGDRSGSISFDFFHDFGSSAAGFYGMEELWNAFNNGTSLTVRFTTDVTGDYYWYAACNIASLSMTADHNDAVTCSGELTLTGAITKADN